MDTATTDRTPPRVSDDGRVLFTWRDLPKISPPDSYGWELYEGVLYVADSPTVSHQTVIKNLVRFLMRAVEDAGTGEVFFSPLDVVLEDTTVFQPDVIVVTTRNKRVAFDRKVFGPPEWVAEVLSPSTAAREIGRKTGLYLRHGVKEVWILDPRERWLETVRGKAGSPIRTRHGPDGTVLSTALSVSVPLSRIFGSYAARRSRPNPG